MGSKKNFPDLIRTALACKCPACAKGNLYRGKMSLETCTHCPLCGLETGRHDSADGPAVFLVFVFGFTFVPLALIVDTLFHWPLWLHALVWTGLILMLTAGALRPVKAFVIALQYHYRPEDWRP